MSVDLSWTVDEDDGVRFVTCHVDNEADVPRRVRIDSRLPGPVFPPRRSGVPEAGWDRDGVTLHLDPGEQRGVGFASLAPTTSTEPTADPPIEIVDREPLPDDETDTCSDSAIEALRTLGEHRPPGDVVASGVAERDRVTPGNGTTAASGVVAAPDRRVDVTANVAGGSDTVGGSDVFDDTHDSETTGTSDRSFGPESKRIGSDPDRIEDWFDAAERRIGRVERLADGDLDSAAETVAVIGGIDAVADLDRRVSVDATLLRRLSERAAALADRAETTDAPVEALERLA